MSPFHVSMPIMTPNQTARHPLRFPVPETPIQSPGERNHAAMKYISIGGLKVSRLGLGAMSMSGYYNVGQGSEAEAIRAIHRALDLGVTHLDTAAIYGPYHNEELVARAVKGRRDHVVLPTRFAVVPHSGAGPGGL